MTDKPGKRVFPKGFLWGGSTASHQVEGGTVNQWSVWELEQAQELAKTARKRLGWLHTWQEIKPQATNPANYVSGKGVDHYNRYKEDFDIAKQLKLNAHRFGLEWARLQPEEGAWNLEALEHYRDYIAELRKRNLEPIVNLWHWTMPNWFVAKGGFEKTANLKYWDEFVERVVKEYGKELKYILTVNEPNVYASFGYLTGEWPPQRRQPLQFLVVYWNLAQAHKRAYNIIKRHNRYIQVGVAQQLANIQAKRPHNVVDVLATKWMRYFWNWWFLNRIRRHQDFVGFNYYFTDYYRGFSRVNPKLPVNDMGWYMEPEGLYPLIMRVAAHYKKPIMITENGVADGGDQYRQWWLEETIIAMERAISDGAPVIGYMHWSLLDNFEWKYGWWPKFGLVHVDREHGMKRTIRPSAEWFAEEIKKLSN